MRDTLKKAVSAICVLYIAASVVTLCVSSSYAIPVGDDLLNLPVIPSDANRLAFLFQNALRTAVFMYLNWQGTFFTVFIHKLLQPVSGAGFSGLRPLMFLYALFLLLSLLCLLYSFIRIRLRKDMLFTLSVTAVILFGLLNLQTYEEIFFQYVVSAIYCLPLTCAMFVTSLYLRILNASKPAPVLTVLAGILGFLSCGGVLMVAGVSCYMLLLLVTHDRLKNGRWNRPAVVIFLTTLLAAFINALAPGNYVRKEAIGGSMNPLSAILGTLKYMYLEIEKLLSDSILLAVLIAALIFGICFYTHQQESPSRLTRIYLFLAMLTPMVALFPLLLGNGNAGISNRGSFVIDLPLLLTMFACCYYLGQWLATHLTENNRAPVILILCLQLLMAVSFNRADILTLPQSVLVRDLARGAYKDYYDRSLALYQHLETTDEADIVLRIPEDVPEDLRYYLNLGLTTDPAYHNNFCLAEFCHKTSIRIENK